ncbi:hypothetical protein PUR61_38620 [Streptomyces sp. BE20]|uniref:hypothetical protein n=1 Tax=Streptomyces sp. BE20 TaxID=3002525 RepID=UPI002E7848F1|nr:hypothetical protein [Streptomyces sp. BE20]MEE1828051.1 hypothetical protein [Streptomyces sp. BE20]
MSGNYNAEGVIWLERPLPADRFTDGPWLASVPERAALLVPGHALTREWIEAGDTDLATSSGLLLLPGDSPATVAGLAWRADGEDLPETLLLAGLHRFAQAAAGSRAALWGVSLTYSDGITCHPAVLDHTDGRFHHQPLPPMPAMGGAWFPAPQRRAALFTSAQAGAGPDAGTAAVPAPEPHAFEGPFGPLALALAAAHPGLSKGALVALYTFAALWDTTRRPVPTSAVARHSHLTERTVARHLGQWTALRRDGNTWAPARPGDSRRTPA